MDKETRELVTYVIDRGEDSDVLTNRFRSTITNTPNIPRKRSLSPFFEKIKKQRLENLAGSSDLPIDNKADGVVKLPTSTAQNVNSDIQFLTRSSDKETVEKKQYEANEENAAVRVTTLEGSSNKSPNTSGSVNPRCVEVSETQIPHPLSQIPEHNLKSNKKCYSVLWAKASTRKHKKWEGDGYIFLDGKALTLKNLTGKVLDSSSNYKLDFDSLEDGKIIKLGNKEIEIQELLNADPFGKVEKEPITNVPVPIIKAKFSSNVSRPFVLPCARPTQEKANADATKPMFDPYAPNALVMPKLEKDETVMVVVDPHISHHLRIHQREGVTFLYNCLTNRYNQGVILADEMGLGKTLQCIAVLWTLMKQSPYGRKDVVKRAIVVTPSSLVTNWEKEFNRWLGTERIRVYAVNSDHPIKQYPPQCPVLIISYDMATRSEDALKRMKFDLMICDEAHKIKNVNGQAYNLLYNLNCKKRILLTGTPMQNELMELYSLIDFANPGILGKDYEFRKNFEKPISKFQENPFETSDNQCYEALQLNAELKTFFLRRGHEVMTHYLPPKVTSIVICKPTDLQKQLYNKLLSSKCVEDHLKDHGFEGGSSQSALSIILALKKICNHPNLAHMKNQTKDDDRFYGELNSIFSQGFRHDTYQINHSGKLKVLVSLLKNIKDMNEKVVLVSHYTKTLDVFEEMCNCNNFKFKRLDGTTKSSVRQNLVDQYNRSPDEFLFLLSSKAGGIGLNLQGACNIILYDIDWNPAHDIQAMARCWRPGQKRETHIYRLLTSGTIEEKMYHRQITKMDLSGSVMDLLMSNASVKFSKQDLKDIFTFYDGKTCLTHDLLLCDCNCDGNNELNRDDMDIEDLENMSPPLKKPKRMSTMGELSKWEHFGPPFSNLENPGLRNATSDLQFVFRSSSSNDKVVCEDLK